jgi:hypothetical protein
LNVLFISLAAGLLVSVLARSQMSAFINAFGLLACLNLLQPILAVLASTTLKLPLSWLSPVFSFSRIGEKAYGSGALSFWVSLGLSHGMGWLLLGLAAVLLNLNWRKLHEPRAVRSTVPQARRLISAPRVVLPGRENKHRTFAPVARAVLRLPQQQSLAWVAATISFVGSVWTAFMINRLGSVWAAGTVSVVLSFASLGLFAFLAGRFFFEARRNGELELLLVTPVGARGILREQRLALLRMFRGPFYLTLVGAIPAAVSSMSVNDGNALMGLQQAVSQLANVALGIMAVGAVGMWFGTRVNSSLAMAGCAVGLVEVVPVILVYLLPLLFFSAGFRTWLVLVPLLFVVKNLFFMWWAWARLRREFRARDQNPLEGFLPEFLMGGSGSWRVMRDT